MLIHHSFEQDYDLEHPEHHADAWRFKWPNTADFNFNYYRLLNDAGRADRGIGKPGPAKRKIAIVGAGVAGLVAARELFRSGYTDIHLFEASERIGGRLHSVPVAPGAKTCFEFGAMRMPFFTRPGSRNSVLDYYASIFKIRTMDFPNPDGSHGVHVGIYMNEGQGPDPGAELRPPEMLIWKDKEPPHEKLRAVVALWGQFASRFSDQAKQHYGNDPAWPQFWQNFVQNYEHLTFRQFVLLPPVHGQEAQAQFGGLGMDQDQADLFYVMGAGDGGWGAFYDISVLFPIRTLLFGYGTAHQLVIGSDLHFPLPNLPQDSLGQALSAPNFLGIQSLPECLFYLGSARHPSLWQAVAGRMGPCLWSDSAVTEIEKLADGKLRVVSNRYSDIYDAVILTMPTWALQMGTRLQGFTPPQLPWLVRQTFKTNHWIASCKVFYPLKKRYWGVDSHGVELPLPQLFASDTFLQGSYGYAVGKEAGAILLSYTWEDDATKLDTNESDEHLAKRCLLKLDRILLSCGKPPISSYIDTSRAAVVHWSRVPNTRGCAKLYRAGSERGNRAILEHNERCAKASGLYFAGEGYSVEGGWTEPAMRMALDAVMYIIRDTGGSFSHRQFDFARDYPRWGAKWGGQGS